MRLRLMTAFILVVLVAIASVVIFVRLDSANQVQVYMFRGGMTGTETLVTSLESYYAQNNSWQGVDTYFQPGMGMMNGLGGSGFGHRQGTGMMSQNLKLADLNGKVLAGQGEINPEEQLTADQISKSINLTNDSGTTIGYLLVNNGLNFQPADALPLVQKLDDAALRAGLLAGGIALALALVLSARLLLPIGQLTNAARRLAAGDLDQKVQAKGNDELATLARSFNTMTESLKHSEEERRSMTADIAHELRTPLSVQRAHLEALLDGIYPYTKDNIQIVLDQTVLLSRLVEDLRTLALSDAGELPLEIIRVNLAEIVEQTVNRFQSQAQSRGIDLKLIKPDELICPQVMADPGRIEQILNNLISNALRYTPQDGQILVSLTCDQRQAEIRVRDSGDGIPPEALPYVFDRFYRVDRSRARQDGGSGLGLAIARQLARAHQGDLTASNHPGGGAEFVLSLPIQLNETR